MIIDIKIDSEKNQHFVMIEYDDKKYIYTNQNVGLSKNVTQLAEYPNN
jgi:hypothetical protein